MAFEFFVGVIAQKATIGLQAYTPSGLDFIPKVLLFWSDRQGAVGNNTNASFSTGIAVASGSQVGVCAKSTTGNFGGDGDSRHDNSVCCLAIDDAPVIVGSASLDSVQQGGFTLDWAVTDGDSTRRWYFAALGGSDLQDAFLKEITSPTSPGVQSYSGVGFLSDCLITLTAGIVSAPPSNDTKGSIGIGWGTGPSSRASMGFASRSVNPTQTNRSLTTSHIINLPFADAVFLQADIDSINSDGFSLDWETVQATSRYCWVLCLKGGSYYNGEISQKPTTGTLSYNGFGLNPVGILFGSQCDATDSTVVNGDATMAFGAASSPSEQGCIWYGDDDNVNTTNTDRSNATSVIQLRSSPTANLDAEANLNSFDEDGITLEWTTADAIERKLIVLAFGNSELEDIIIIQNESPDVIELIKTAGY